MKHAITRTFHPQNDNTNPSNHFVKELSFPSSPERNQYVQRRKTQNEHKPSNNSTYSPLTTNRPNFANEKTLPPNETLT